MHSAKVTVSFAARLFTATSIAVILPITYLYHRPPEIILASAVMTDLVGYGSSDEEESLNQDRQIRLNTPVRVSHIMTRNSNTSLLLIG